MLTRGAAGSEDAIRTAENILHEFSLFAKVATISLDDADRVNPEISDSEGSCCVYGILECGWQLIIGNPFQEGVKFLSPTARVLSQRPKWRVLGNVPPSV